MLTKEFVMQFDPCNVSLENLRLFVAQAKPLVDLEFEWLNDKLATAQMELKARVNADKQRQLKALKAKREALLPQSEKLKNADKEIAALEKDLASA